MRLWINLGGIALFAYAITVRASGPVDFGKQEFNAAIANLKYKPKIKTELNLDQPETFRIEPYASGGAQITGGDLRGLMYGLLEAAGQIHESGRLKRARGAPAVEPRGVRIAADTSAPWFRSEEFWRGYFATMARSRLDRLQLVFESLPEQRDAASIQKIADKGVEYGVDVALGFKRLPNNQPLGTAILDLLEKCPAIHAIVVDPEDPALDTWRDEILEAVGRTGRRVVLETGTGENTSAFADAAEKAKLPLRLFSRYDCSGDDIDCTRMSDRGERVIPRRSFYWKMDPVQTSAKEAVVRALIPKLNAGFEIAAPLVPDDATGHPGTLGLETWGRLGYDPKPPQAAVAKPAVKSKSRTKRKPQR